MNKFTVLMLVIIGVGIWLMVSAMAPDVTAHAASNCYNLLNNAGQVVGVACH